MTKNEVLEIAILFLIKFYTKMFTIKDIPYKKCYNNAIIR